MRRDITKNRELLWLRGGVKKVVLLGGGGRWGEGFEARPQLSAKKVQVFFLLSFDSEPFKTCKYTHKKIYLGVPPPPPPNQPNPCVLVFVIGASVTGGPWAVILGGFKKRFRGYIQLQICCYSKDLANQSTALLIFFHLAIIFESALCERLE